MRIYKTREDFDNLDLTNVFPGTICTIIGEAARTCRVSDGTFGVLIGAVRTANGTVSTDKAGSGDGSGQPAAGPDRPNGARTGPVDRAGGGDVR